jgi:hypothetical protein
MPNRMLTVRIDRADGTRTYRCHTASVQRAEREALAWRESFPEYVATVVEYWDVREDFRAWERATRHGIQYTPTYVAEQVTQ